VPGLAVWLEVDYGLYQDRAATLPAVADGDPVNAWVNRGYAGALKISTGFSPMVLRISGAHRWLETTGAISEPLNVVFRKYTYIFGVAFDPASLSARSISRCSPENGIFSSANPTLQIQHGTISLPRSNSTIQSLTRTITSTKIMGEGRSDFAYFSENTEHFGAVNSARVMRAATSGAFPISGGTTAATEAQETPAALRFFGIETGSGFSEGGMSKVKALVMYFSDTPLSPAQMESVANNLAVKYDAYLYKAANWGN
jgi:hypothetical protein